MISAFTKGGMTVADWLTGLRGEREAEDPASLQEPALAKIAQISGNGLLDKIHRKLQKAYLPRIIHPLDHGAERFLGKLARALDTFRCSLDRALQDLFHDISPPELKSVF